MGKRNLYLKTIPVEEAKNLYETALGNVWETKYEEIPVVEACGRVTRHAVYAKNSSPLYNASAMDGIARSCMIVSAAIARRPWFSASASRSRSVLSRWDRPDALAAHEDACLAAFDGSALTAADTDGTFVADCETDGLNGTVCGREGVSDFITSILPDGLRPKHPLAEMKDTRTATSTTA